MNDCKVNRYVEVSGAERIAASFAQAAIDTEARKARIGVLLARHPDGYKVGKWVKVTIAGDVFWNKGSQYLPGGQLLETCGTALVACGALTSAEFYQ